MGLSKQNEVFPIKTSRRPRWRKVQGRPGPRITPSRRLRRAAVGMRHVEHHPAAPRNSPRGRPCNFGECKQVGLSMVTRAVRSGNRQCVANRLFQKPRSSSVSCRLNSGASWRREATARSRSRPELGDLRRRGKRRRGRSPSQEERRQGSHGTVRRLGPWSNGGVRGSDHRPRSRYGRRKNRSASRWSTRPARCAGMS